MNKKWFQSKTIWLNAVTFLASGLGALAGSDWIKDNPESAAVVGGLIAVCNIVLRFITKQAIAK
jgi:hypothetical protein